ncbi:MAG: 3-deoxy-manno-octulosonate cytidylyltransferase [Flavobacteriales bacterium]|jgi:3-deoxy-manno-octulosonate cytidylyltransferase (CMP-KDO synthetase)
MKVLGVIPARYASSRFPGKPLIDLKGKSMIQRVYEGARMSEMITDVIIATDDQRIVDEALRFGGNVVLTDPNHPSGTDRCAEVALQHPEMDVIINIQGDEPLVDYRQLEQLIHVFKNSDVQIATLGNRSISMEDLQNPNRIKIVLDKNHNALYFSRSAIPNFHHSKGEPLTNYPYLRHIGLYAYRAAVLQELTKLQQTALERIESLEQLRWLYNGYPVTIVESEIETPNIDVPEDVEKVLAQL